MTAETTQDVLSLAAFAALLCEHCAGGGWDAVPRLEPTPHWGDCEACGSHPCTPQQAATLNALFATLRECGAPSPDCCYPHCGGDVFVEWGSADRTRLVVLDVFNRFGRDALVRVDGATHFVKVGAA